MFSAPSDAFGAGLLAFFLSSSKLTKVGAARKRKLEDEYAEARTAVQVFSNGAVLTAAATAFSWHCLTSGGGAYDGTASACFSVASVPFLSLAAALGSLACCNGDTWSSELGILARTKPRLITSFREVPAGVNGGMTARGTAAAACGGSVVGLSMGLFAPSFVTAASGCGSGHAAATAMRVLGGGHAGWPLSQGVCADARVLIGYVAVGGLFGLVGSVVDSLLGATLQASYWDERRKVVVAKPGKDTVHVSGVNVLDNHQVNLVASIISALLCAATASHWAPWIVAA